MKERNRAERGTGMKVKKQKKEKHCLTVNQYQLDAPVTEDTRPVMGDSGNDGKVVQFVVIFG